MRRSESADRVMAVLPPYVVPKQVRDLAQQYLNEGTVKAAWVKAAWRDLYRFILTLPCEAEPDWAQAAREAGWTPPVSASPAPFGGGG